MTFGDITSAGYLSAAAAYLLLAVLLLSIWRERPKSPIFALASVVTFVWSLVISISHLIDIELSILVTVSELMRGAVWAILFVLILGTFKDLRGVSWTAPRLVLSLVVAFSLSSLTYALGGDPGWAENILASGGLALAIALVVLVEQVFRNAPPELNSDFRYLCLAVAVMFFYDVLLHGRTVVEGSRVDSLWAARGYVNALLVLPIAFAVKRRMNLSVDTLISRQIVFYSFALAAIGIVLLGIFAVDYYLRTFGGVLSDILRLLFATTVAILIAFIAISPSVRATGRVLMTKALFQYKYDYRREWLRFVATLSQSAPGGPVPETAVKAVAQLVNSPGGAAWYRFEDDRAFVVVGSWQCTLSGSPAIGDDASIVQFLMDTEWVVDLHEMKEHPARYAGQTGHDVPERDKNWWLIVPMLLGDKMSGFILLLQPSVVPVLNFEDHDLLKTAGRHVATHIEQAETDRRLAEASQFGAYNRLTAFLMHDLNNLIAQQSLVVDNAEKFRHNPDFLDDAIGTISHSVDRMKRLMEQLTSASKAPENKRVNLSRTINSAVKRTSGRKPMPELVKCKFDIHVQADAERLSMVLEHLLRNAQEATPPEGNVTIEAEAIDGMAQIKIADTGSGMTQEFIRTRLFRPFDSTKGSQGMGIGVYQAREYARALGGYLEVSSEKGKGTEFTIRLPVS